MSSIPRFRAVLFDIGGTLVKSVQSVETYRRILASCGVEASVDAIAEVHAESMRALDNREMAEEGTAFWLRWNTKILERVGVRDNVEMLAKRISDAWWDYSDIEMYPDVLGTLGSLKARGVKLGIVTNGFREDIDQIFQRLRLKPYFDVCVGSDACRKAKPDKEIFLYALDKLGVRADEALFVGNDVNRDYEGATNAGLRALLIDREGKFGSHSASISSLDEVLAYI